MKVLLLASQVACIASLLGSGTWRRYPFLTGLLCLQTAAVTIYTQDQRAIWIDGPVLVFRFMATLEIVHRQTSHFRYWSGITGGAMLLAVFYTASVWQSPVDDFQTFRRVLQIWCAAYFVVVLIFWVSQQYWWPSLPNWISLWFGLSLLNHAAVSLASSLGKWTWLGWWKASMWSWGAEAFSCLGLAAVMVLCRRGRACD